MRIASVRRGSALPAVFALAVLIAALLIASSDRVMSVKRQQELGAAKQQATYAAESVAAMKEVQLVNLAASNDLAGLDAAPNPNSGSCWFGNCLVRWRVEPVRVANADGAFTVNPISDPNALAPAGGAGASYVANPDLYVFRIATEADYLAEPDRPGVRPFAQPPGEAADGMTYDPSDRVCAMQASRLVQLKINALFKYAIFYGAEGPTGDLEFWVGTGISVQGAIHSNGAIYVGGHGNRYLGGNFWDACSGGGPVTLGAAGAGQINITGIDGIYRMRKVCNELAARTPGHPIAAPIANGATPNPMGVPLPASPVWSSSAQNLNGDDPASTLHSINGLAFTSANDSRNPTFPAPFGAHVRDKGTGATVVKTLANIPQLAGRPFESQRLAADDQRLYWRSAVDHRLTIDTRTYAAAVPLYYTDFAGGNYATTDAPTDAGGNPRTPVFARNLPLFAPLAPATDPDVWPSDPTQPGYAPPPVAPATALTGAPQFEGFPVGEQRGFYLDVALHGGAKSVPDTGAAAFVVTDGKTGLVIRERPAQKAALWPAATGLTGRMPDEALAPWNGAPFATFAADYAAYMRSQYLVLIGGLDVTDAFFGQIAGAASRDDFICTEDAIVNMREATDMHVFYGLDRAAGMPGGTPYSVDVLTLNLRAVQDWLKSTDWVTLGGAPGGGAPKAKDHFTGFIYAHRTRRSLTYHPLLRPTLVLNPWSRPNATYSTAGLSAANWPWAVREGDGPIETFHCAIRLRGGADIDWAHGAGPAPLGTSGLTIATPNMCYVQGDFNTTTHVDASGKPQLPPCAVFSDGVTALSNGWRDADHRGLVSSPTTGTATTYNLSYVINNVPTDDVTALDEGSGAVGNVVRFLEDWGGRAYNFKGSLVVMNKMRYSFTTLGASPGPSNDFTDFYQPPTRNIAFNTDLLSRAGQPPYTPFGVQVIRTVSTLVEATE